MVPIIVLDFPNVVRGSTNVFWYHSKPPPRRTYPRAKFFWGRGASLNRVVSFPVWKYFELFYFFSVWDSLSEKSLNISSFFHSEIPVWKDFEYFTVVSVWDPHLKRLWKFYDFSCLKILWILHDFLNLKSPPEKTLKISWFFLSEIPVWKLFEYFMISHVWNPCLKRLWIFFSV